MDRSLVYCLFLILSLTGFAQNDFAKKTITILATSELTIKGDTNISEFGCVFNTIYLEEFSEILYLKNGNNISFNNAILTLKNKGFDCGNNVINKDFHSLLKTTEYPIITLELTKINIDKYQKGKAFVKITIAGIIKEYTFPVNIISSPMDRFIGKLKLDIRDFNLKPPKKMFGLIVIDEEIEIDFNLVARL